MPLKAGIPVLQGGEDVNLSEWVEQKRRQFEAAHPEHRKRSGESRIAFDRWLEGMK